MEDAFGRLRRLIIESCNRCQINAIALSGGLDSTILAYCLKEKKPKCMAVIADDFVATDLTYCQTVAKEFNIAFHISHTSTKAILDAIEETVRILGNFNDIEIRNSIVMYLALRWAKDSGLDGLITGDGADELFAGYNFLLDKPQDQLEEELERINRIMHFPSHKIGKRLGMTVESPFLNDDVAKFARSMPARFKIRQKNGKAYGKWILRKAFEGLIPRQITWRTKSPMQDGAGTVGLTGLFESVTDDDTFEEKKENILKQDCITIRTKESLYYYETYRKIHGVPGRSKSGRACPYCGCVIDSKFCRMCGAFPV